MTATVVQAAPRRARLPFAPEAAVDRLRLSGEEVLVESLLLAVASAFERVLGRPLQWQSYSELIEGHTHVLHSWPVDPSSVMVTANDQNVGYKLDPSAGILTLLGCSSGAEASYSAGWVTPGVLGPWSPSAPVALGDWVYSSGSVPLLFECTTAGTTDLEEPAWPASAGGNVIDGSVSWKAQNAIELPHELQQLAFVALRDMHAELGRASALLSQRAEGFAETYRESGPAGDVSDVILRRVSAYRGRAA